MITCNLGKRRAAGAPHAPKDRFTRRMFRNILDSGQVELDDVTCLVGKNEAGKSAIMQALHALNPARPPQASSCSMSTRAG